MAEDRKTIYLCLAHISEEGNEQKYVKEAFEHDWADFADSKPIRDRRRTIEYA